jgi:hypothetical protein
MICCLLWREQLNMKITDNTSIISKVASIYDDNKNRINQQRN